MELSPRFTDALAYAAELHAKQKRKGTEVPYISHLLRVAGIALEHGADEDEAIAALLHDAVEDQPGESTRQAIRQRFGQRVLQIVEGCSDTDQHPKPPWRARKEAYLARLATASHSVRLISACDKLDNAWTTLVGCRAFGSSYWSRFRGGRQGTLWYLRSVTEILKTRDRTPLVDELDRVVTELERVAGTTGQEIEDARQSQAQDT